MVYTEGVSYLIIVQDKAEASNSRFEWGEGICRFLCCTEEQFGRGRCSGLPQPKFALICSIWFALAGTESILSPIENGGAVYIVCETYQKQN